MAARLPSTIDVWWIKERLRVTTGSMEYASISPELSGNYIASKKIHEHDASIDIDWKYMNNWNYESKIYVDRFLPLASLMIMWGRRGEAFTTCQPLNEYIIIWIFFSIIISHAKWSIHFTITTQMHCGQWTRWKKQVCQCHCVVCACVMGITMAISIFNSLF